MEKRKIIQSLINIGTYKDFITEIFMLSSKENSSYVCVSNVHMMIEAYNSEKFSEVVNGANIATPDGMPLAKSIKYLYGIEQDRVAGMDLMPDLMAKSEEEDKSIFLYGSTPTVLDGIIEKAKKEYPKLKISSYSPPFRELSSKEKDEIINMINSYNPDFVFVALGCPKQEIWMAEHQGKVESCMIGLGGAFEVYADMKDRAPEWMQKNSLEWVYRLVQDPKRLWKRYLYTNTHYVVLLFKQFLSYKILKN